MGDSADRIIRRARERVGREIKALEEKHLPSMTEMAGFCCTQRCVCSFRTGPLAPPPCIPCRSRAFSDALRALSAKLARPPSPRPDNQTEGETT